MVLSFSSEAQEELKGFTVNVPVFQEEQVSESFEISKNEGSDTGSPNLGGQWEIVEADKTYVATLDPGGNGGYTWQNGIMVTTHFSDRKWEGTWHQTGNDREGGFEVLLSEDGNQARGIWWYTRVGNQKNIPPREWGGDYTWNRLSSGPDRKNSEGSISKTRPISSQEIKIKNEEDP